MSKTTKALKKQAARSELVAQRASPLLAQEMTSLADAFRAQAAVLKKEEQKEEMKCPTL
jgi:cellobiose-specific phosphotransferase system component IIA